MNKIKNIGISLLPSGMWLLLQVVVSAVFMAGTQFLFGIYTGAGRDVSRIAEYMAGNSVYMMSVLINIIVLFPGCFWYSALCGRENHALSLKPGFSAGAVLRLICLGAAIQFVTDIGLVFAQALFPAAMEEYGKVIESLGILSPGFWSVLYTVILAPAAEELLFRGVTLKILEQEFSFWQANILQALYFGMFHGNPVQGIYAFFCGMLLGYTVKKYKSLKAAVLCHFAVNITGNIMGGIQVSLWMLAVGAVLLVLAVLALRDRDF